ncbi:hypothetical protein GCM10010252_08080 [Streptomyces aureoverticillatus]|nr:hypothetical protein GCM10010252_08080 [Streptomyces aureoverticillatus]
MLLFVGSGKAALRYAAALLFGAMLIYMRAAPTKAVCLLARLGYRHGHRAAAGLGTPRWIRVPRSGVPETG